MQKNKYNKKKNNNNKNKKMKKEQDHMIILALSILAIIYNLIQILKVITNDY